MKTAAIILLSILGFTSVIAQPDRTRGWSNDIDYLLAKVKEQHYVYKNKDLPPTMVRSAEELKTRIPDFTDERMLIELQGLMYHLGDGHSYILPLLATITESKFLPLHFYEFTDGMYVIDADAANARLIGMKVRSIAGATPEKIMHDMVTFVSQDNTVGAHWLGPVFMRQRGLLERYGLAKGSQTALIKFEDRKGTKFEALVPFVPPTDFRGVPKMVPAKNTAPEKIPLYLTNVGDNFWFRYLPEHKAMYFQWNQVQNKEGETLAAFSKRLENELKTLNPTLLIVDVRHNNGGNGYLNTAVINMMKNFQESQKGKLVIITGRNTFSAAQIFIGRADHETNVVFAGEPSSSKPNFVGEENEVVLPYSGARGSISNRYHESIPGDTRQWIAPELEVRLSSRDYFGNNDPVLKAVLNKYGK